MKANVDADARYPYRVQLTLNHAEEWFRDMYRPRTEIGEWLGEMCELPYKVTYGRGAILSEFWTGTVHFMSNKDAIAFKLAWS